MKLLRNYEKYKTLYSEIAAQSSFCERNKLFIKHIGDFQYSKIYRKRNERMKEEMLGNEDFLSEENKLSILKSHGLWSDKEEDQIISLEWIISDNKKNCAKIAVPHQRITIEKIITQKQSELDELIKRKETLVGETKERYSSIFASEIIIQTSFFKDEECAIPAFSEEEYEAFSDEEVSILNKCYGEFLSNFNERNLRTIATLPFFLNGLSHCKERPCDFFGIPIAKHSHLQSELLSKGFRNLNVLENTEGEPPEINEQLEEKEIVDWYDSQYSVLLGKSKNGGSIGTSTSKKYVKSKE